MRRLIVAAAVLTAAPARQDLTFDARLAIVAKDHPTLVETDWTL